MMFRIPLQLLIELTAIQFVKLNVLSGNCDFHERVPIGQKITITSPGWPSAYSPGGTCRWVIDCHVGYVCRLRCREVGLPATEKCYMDKLLVSVTGNLKLQDARVHCGSKRFNARSTERKLSIALITSRYSPGGRFRCTVQSEKWSNPRYRPRSNCGRHCYPSYVH